MYSYIHSHLVPLRPHASFLHCISMLSPYQVVKYIQYSNDISMILHTSLSPWCLVTSSESVEVEVLSLERGGRSPVAEVSALRLLPCVGAPGILPRLGRIIPSNTQSRQRKRLGHPNMRGQNSIYKYLQYPGFFFYIFLEIHTMG